MSAEDVAVFAFLRFLRQGDGSEFTDPLGPARPYRVGLMLEARQIAAVGRRIGYFGGDQLTSRWLTRSSEKVEAEAAALPPDALAQLPAMISTDELLRGEMGEPDSRLQREFQRMLLIRSQLNAHRRAAVLMSWLLFDDDEQWASTPMAQLHDAYRVAEQHTALIDSVVALPQLAQELLGCEQLTTDRDVSWPELDGDETDGRGRLNQMDREDADALRDAQRWLAPESDVGHERQGEWRHKQPAATLLARHVAYGLSLWTSAPQRVATSDMPLWADAEAAALSRFAQRALPFVDGPSTASWPLLAWRVGPLDSRALARLDILLATVMPVLQYYPLRSLHSD